MDAIFKIRNIIDIAWESYSSKVSAGLLEPENEKMMQLQFAQILQSLSPIFEFHDKESIKVLLEVPLLIDRTPNRRIIDILILYTEGKTKKYFPIELKCFREYTREGTGKKRGAQNLGMFDYWADIENIEQYCICHKHSFGTQLTLTDDYYYVHGEHKGPQVSIYSTNMRRKDVSRSLIQNIANRSGKIDLAGIYSMEDWKKKGNFYFIRQEFTLKKSEKELHKTA
jgi:hypothetical protein